MQDPVDGMRRVDPGYRGQHGKISFSRTEILHLTIAIVVLSMAFSIIMRGSRIVPDQTLNIAYIVGISVILVVCSFLLHEMGHKFVAQRYKAWSEFRIYPVGLLMALLFSLAGFLFAAPGAVYIRGNIDREMNGKISLSGPGVNFSVAGAAILLCLVLDPGSLAFQIILMLAYLNAFLGLFNMIPVPPFDGSKIVAWDIRVYIATVAIGAAELAVIWFHLM
ncbi:MAG: site-2 protease family protein [Candidatus Methanoplasma sp.]|jgi:Zn-dependent protease|nr:site-2 protease family protein [Candidatus Methanoplasma sp.]